MNEAPMLAHVALAASVVPVLVGFGSRRRLPILWTMLILGAISNLSSFVMSALGVHNLALSYLYPPIEIILVLEMLRHWPPFDGWLKLFRAGQVVALVGAAVALVNAANPEMVTQFESVMYPFWAFIVVGLIVMAVANPLRRRSDYLAGVALLFYYVPVALLYPFLNGVTVSVFTKLFQALLLCHVIAYAVFTVAFWRERHRV